MLIGLAVLTALLPAAPAMAQPLPPQQLTAPSRLYLPLVNKFYDPALYDNFDNPAYEGAWNPSLWTWADWNPEWVKMQQQNGALVLWNTTPAELGGGQLLVKTPAQRQRAQPWFVEARLKISSDRQGGLSTVQLKAHTDLTGKSWTAYCLLGGSTATVTARFSCGILSGEYSTVEVQVRYDRWQTAKIEILPGTAELRFYLNDTLVGTRIPRDAAALKNVTELVPNVQLWNGAPDATSTRYVDDVRIAPR